MYDVESTTNITAEWHRVRPTMQRRSYLSRYKRGRHHQPSLVRRKSNRLIAAAVLAVALLPTIFLGS